MFLFVRHKLFDDGLRRLSDLKGKARILVRIKALARELEEDGS
jgi:hypothetical protein